jgi:hypothetical protein
VDSSEWELSTHADVACKRRSIGMADEDEKRWEERLKKVAKAKPEKPE